MLHTRLGLPIIAIVLAFLMAALSGCQIPLGYAMSALTGEVQLLARTIPIEQALNHPALTEEQKEKLAYIIKARDYAEQVIGLNVGGSYHNFAFIGEGPLAWNLSASRKDALEPYYWFVPIVGPTPYFGFFVFDQALQERDRLVGLGYDTLIYEIDAYSTLGLLPDPIASSLLDRNLVSLMDTVFHELLHNTIFTADDSGYNESLATFVGRTGAVEFIQLEFGKDSELAQQAWEQFEDEDRFNTYMHEVIQEATTLYNKDLTYEEKLEAREDLFEQVKQRFVDQVQPLMNNPENYDYFADLNINNAFLLVNQRYTSNLDVFEAIFEMTGRSWPAALNLFAQAAAADNAIEYLKALLAE